MYIYDYIYACPFFLCTFLPFLGSLFPCSLPLLSCFGSLVRAFFLTPISSFRFSQDLSLVRAFADSLLLFHTLSQHHFVLYCN